MNNLEILLIIIATVGTIFGIFGIVFPKLKLKGIDTEKILASVGTGLGVANNAIDTIKALAPNTPYINVADKIVEYAQQGVLKAEQLRKANEISDDARKAEAIQLVKDLFTVINVEVTPDVENAIDGAVEAAVYALPKTNAVTGESSTAPAQASTEPIAEVTVATV